MPRWVQAQTLLVLLTASGCTDEVPTVYGGERIPIQSEIVEVQLPFSAFAADLRSFPGFGSPSELAVPVIAHRWAGELDSHLLIRFGDLPASVSVLPPGATSGTQIDSTYQVVRGDVVVRFDTAGVRMDTAFGVEWEAILSDWDPGSATWELAVDTIGGTAPWALPGGGPTRPLGSGGWAPAVADSLILGVDSVTIAEWTDAERADRGLRLRGTTQGSRLRLLSALLRLRVRSQVNPDTLVVLDIRDRESTVVYTPEPAASADVLRIGGAPATRATFRVALPRTADPGPAGCGRLDCPVEITAPGILYAALGLHTHTTLSPGFAPVDTAVVELRPVLSPDRLPRSPIAAPVHGALEGIPPERFGPAAGAAYEIPMTGYLRAVVESGAPAGEAEEPTIALVVAPEPQGLEVLSFYGPGTELEPYLRLILSVADGVPLP